MRVTRNHLTGTFILLVAILSLACSDSIAPAAPATGALAITVVTRGAEIDIDPDGYAYSLDGGPGHSLAVSSEVTITNLLTGDHLVSLYGLAPNCSVSGNPRHAVVNASGVASLVAFDVSCGPPWECDYWDPCSYSGQNVGTDEIRYPLMLRGRPSASLRGGR